MEATGGIRAHLRYLHGSREPSNSPSTQRTQRKQRREREEQPHSRIPRKVREGRKGTGKKRMGRGRQWQSTRSPVHACPNLLQSRRDDRRNRWLLPPVPGLGFFAGMNRGVRYAPPPVAFFRRFAASKPSESGNSSDAKDRDAPEAYEAAARGGGSFRGHAFTGMHPIPVHWGGTANRKMRGGQNKPSAKAYNVMG